MIRLLFTHHLVERLKVLGGLFIEGFLKIAGSGRYWFQVSADKNTWGIFQIKLRLPEYMTDMQ